MDHIYPNAESENGVGALSERLYARAVELINGPNPDRRAAAEILQRLCHFHPQPSIPIYALAEIYFEGEGNVPRDLPTRFRLLQRGASLRCGNCIYRLALAYQFGEGTPVNTESAVRLLQMIWTRSVHVSDEWRSDAGMALASLLLQREDDREETVNRVIDMYDQIRQDDFNAITATLALGRLLQSSTRGSHADLVRARLMYFEAAGLEGNGQILFELAWMLEHGQGGPTNLVRAYMYYQRANDVQVEGAEEKMEEVRERIRALYPSFF